ncbi:diguanylate cyclase domain-containing protein [Paenibacillus koleovorans]|uniref:diguanylate cyclase domain-containing protein n=1 Tax=Paenibacillus koleovorans TaxID=121608 RepID=UPI000FD70E12|nr:diguanylate cyclase [Paenibacillus koleovorans]
MKRHQNSLIADGAFLFLFLLCFVSILFAAGDPNRYIENMILLNIAFLLAIITYFTTVTTGLILNIVFLFGYGTYTLYQTVVIGEIVGSQTYFWLLLTPAYTLVTWMLTNAYKVLQTENMRLQRANDTLATMDDKTNLKNSRSFQNDATVFMALSVRYKIPLTLLIMNVKYWDELKRMISEDTMTEAIYDLSKLGETSIRTNDSLYMLSKENPTWGLLLFTDRDGAQFVINRLNQSVVEMNTMFSEKYRIELNLRIGATQYDPQTIETPLDFIVQARKQLEYDV